MDAVILRIRPDSAKSAGHRAERLQEIARALVGEQDAGRRPFEAQTAAFPAAPRGHITAGIFAAEIEWAAKADTIVLDLGFSMRRVRRGVIDKLLADTLKRLLDATTDTHRIAVIVGDLKVVKSQDDLGRVVDTHHRRDRVAVIPTDGTSPRSASGWTLSDEVGELAEVTLDELRASFMQRLLRRRGVFQSTRHDEYLRFHYAPHPSNDLLSELVARKLSELAPDAVLYDGSAPEWLSTAVLAAANIETITAGTVGDLTSKSTSKATLEADVWERLRSLVMTADTSMVLVVPLAKSGSALSASVAQIRTVHKGSLCVLAILVDYHFAPLPKGVAPPQSTIKEFGGERIEVHYIERVHQTLLASDHWQVLAARAGNFVEDMSLDWLSPSPVGLWSLYREAGVDIESPVPKSSKRLPIRWFPQLSKMSDEDALWVGECLIRLAKAELGAAVEDLVFVLPDEPSGAEALARALKDRLDVTVLTVTREEIDRGVGNEDLSLQLGRRGGNRIVVVDESTVTYSTLLKIDRLVRDAVNRSPDLAVVALELPIGDHPRPSYLRALHAWRPIVMADPTSGVQ